MRSTECPSSLTWVSWPFVDSTPLFLQSFPQKAQSTNVIVSFPTKITSLVSFFLSACFPFPDPTCPHPGSTSTCPLHWITIACLQAHLYTVCCNMENRKRTIRIHLLPMCFPWNYWHDLYMTFTSSEINKWWLHLVHMHKKIPNNFTAFQNYIGMID